MLSTGSPRGADPARFRLLEQARRDDTCTGQQVVSEGWWVQAASSQPLDHGRKRRFHTPGQRRLIFARDTTCRAEGCEIPANWCHVHHEDPWLHGGPTSVDQGLTLCSRHHSAAHDTRYDTSRRPDGRLRFTRTRR